MLVFTFQGIRFLICSLGICSALSICFPQSGEARSLNDVYNAGVSGFRFSETQSGSPAASLSTGVPEAISAAVAQAIALQFPQASVSPAFTYRLDPTLNLFEPTTTVQGPLFSERAMTIGRGQLNFGVGYSFIDFQELNGTSVNNIINPIGIVTRNPELQEIGTLGPNGLNLLYTPVALTHNAIRMDIQAHILVPNVRYGVTDNWEIGLALPILNTSLRVRTEAVFSVETSSDPTSSTFGGLVFGQDTEGNPDPALFGAFITPDGSTAQSPLGLRFARSQRSPRRLSQASGSKTGVGDIVLRSKYHFWGDELGGAAWGLNLQLPSGDEEDFHGTGETHLSTFLYVSQVLWDRFEPHLNVGVDFNTDDVDNSSFLYAVGATFQIWTNLALSVDFIGRSEFGTISSSRPADITSENGYLSNYPLNRKRDTCTTEQPCFLDTSQPLETTFFFPEKVERNDVADFSFGLRYALESVGGSVFFGCVIPLNNDGFRPDFIPAGGIEYTF